MSMFLYIILLVINGSSSFESSVSVKVKCSLKASVIYRSESLNVLSIVLNASVNSGPNDPEIVSYEWDFDENYGFSRKTREAKTTYTYLRVSSELVEWVPKVRVADYLGNFSVVECGTARINE